MRSIEEITKRLAQYKGAELLYTNQGYIAWQCSTGENYEILFIEVNEKGVGNGRELISQMKKLIKPYYSVFVFRRANNVEAGKFYTALGFNETYIKDLYKGEDAVLSVIPYERM